jgi:hypothetical protein
MSDTNRVSLGIIEEVTPGTTPATPAWQALRITGTPSLAFAPVTVTSNEIRPDRNVTDLILVGAEAGGDVGHELSHGALDTIIEGAMFNDWTERNNRKDGDVTSIASNVITVVAGTTFNVDDLIYLEGFGDANDEVVFPAILTTNTTTITAASGLTDNGSAPSTARVWNVGVQGATGDIDSAISPNRLTSTLLDFQTLGLLVGDWIKIGGTLAANQLPTPANNDWCRVSAIGATSLEFDIVPAGWTADVSTTENVWLFFGDRIRNGVVNKYYSLEQTFQDHSPNTFQYFTGMRPNTLNFTIGTQSIVTASASFLGFGATAVETRFAGSTDIAAPGNSVLNSSSNVGRIGRGVSGEITGPNFILDATLNINNNMRRQNAVGNLGSIGIGGGEFNVTGTINAYFGNKDLLDDVLLNTERSLDMRFTDALNKVVVFDMPRLKYSSGFPAVPGKNQDVLINLGFQGILESANDLYTLQIQRFHKVQ